VIPSPAERIVWLKDSVVGALSTLTCVRRSVIRTIGDVAFFRTFTDIPQPSGRSWFCGESPFHRLDVSFVTSSVHRTIASSGLRAGHPITIRPEYIAQAPANSIADRQAAAPIRPRVVTASETAIGKLLYEYLEAAKSERRGRQPRKSSFVVRSLRDLRG
jgi:hypothetical protein